MSGVGEQRMPLHRVAVTVFATVRAVDQHDADSVVEVAVRQALGTDRMRLPTLIRARSAHSEADVLVHHVTETGRAAGNGYLWTEPTSKAFRERGGTEDPDEFAAGSPSEGGGQDG